MLLWVRFVDMGLVRAVWVSCLNLQTRLLRDINIDIVSLYSMSLSNCHQMMAHVCSYMASSR